MFILTHSYATGCRREPTNSHCIPSENGKLYSGPRRSFFWHTTPAPKRWTHAQFPDGQPERRPSMDRCRPNHAAARLPARGTHRDPAHSPGKVRLPGPANPRPHCRPAGGSAEQGAGRGHLLQSFPHATGRRAHPGGLHRHGLSRQGQRPDPRLGKGAVRPVARRNHPGQPAFAGRGALRGRLRAGAGDRH